jgi:3-oxoacyl-[acyl-carrier protein] reductase
MTGKLEGKVALVTGASKGIGQGLAAGLAAAGARVAVNYKNDTAGAEKTIHTIKRQGGEAAVFQADVGSKQEYEALVAAVAAKWGRLDVLVNNAARTRFGPPFTQTEEDFDDVFNTNVRGPFFGTLAAAQLMLKQGGGSIVNISSCVTALMVPNHGAYTLSKFALEGLTYQFALDLAPTIRVNGIAPAATSNERNHQYDPNYDEKWGHAIPAGRIAQVSDFIGPCVFLASDDSRFLTGQVLRVDGGWHLLGHIPDLSNQDFTRDFKQD